jgi:DNA-binding transcriptional LysR family regulator
MTRGKPVSDTRQEDIATGELIDLELIRRFIVVAEELNFTRAAARLGMAAAAYWAGADSPGPARSQPGGRQAGLPPGPEINDISQLLDAVTLGNAVAYVPVSVAHQQHPADLAFVPVSDLSPSEVVAAWPDTSRSRAVAGFVRAAAEAAASYAGQAAALA